MILVVHQLKFLPQSQLNYSIVSFFIFASEHLNQDSSVCQTPDSLRLLQRTCYSLTNCEQKLTKPKEFLTSVAFVGVFALLG